MDRFFAWATLVVVIAMALPLAILQTELATPGLDLFSPQAAPDNPLNSQNYDYYPKFHGLFGHLALMALGIWMGRTGLGQNKHLANLWLWPGTVILLLCTVFVLHLLLVFDPNTAWLFDAKTAWFSGTDSVWLSAKGSDWFFGAVLEIEIGGALSQAHDLSMLWTWFRASYSIDIQFASGGVCLLGLTQFCPAVGQKAHR